MIQYYDRFFMFVIPTLHETLNSSPTFLPGYITLVYFLVGSQTLQSKSPGQSIDHTRHIVALNLKGGSAISIKGICHPMITSHANVQSAFRNAEKQGV